MRRVLVALLAAVAAVAPAAAAPNPIGGLRGSVRAFAPALTLDLRAPAREKAGSTFDAEVTARNTSRTATINAVTLRLLAPDAVQGAQGVSLVRKIRPREDEEATWQLCVARPGSYVLVASGSYVDPVGGAIAVQSRAELVSISASEHPTCHLPREHESGRG